MITIVEDDVGVHDVMMPACRAETYRHFYNVGHHYSNCFDNLNDSLKAYGIPYFNSIQPFNIFMNTTITQNKTILIEPLVSKAGSKITFKGENEGILRKNLEVSAINTAPARR